MVTRRVDLKDFHKNQSCLYVYAKYVFTVNFVTIVLNGVNASTYLMYTLLTLYYSMRENMKVDRRYNPSCSTTVMLRLRSKGKHQHNNF